MNRRKFLQWLGIGVPAVVAAAVVAPKVEKVVEAKLGEWNNFYSEGDPELMEAIENWHSYSEVYPNLQTTFTLKDQYKSIYFDKEFMQSLRNQTALDAMAKRGEPMPIAAHVRRSFFRYDARHI